MITPSDIGAALGVERQRELIGCSDTGCLAEIGAALGVDYIVHGVLAALERDTALTLTLTDANGREVNQIADVVKGKEAQALLDAVNRDVPKLVQPLRATGKLGSAPVLEAGRVQDTSPDGSGSSHTASYILGGAGALGLVGSAVAGVLAGSNNSALQKATKNPTSSVTPGNVANLRSTITSEAWISTGLLIAGAGAVSVGLALWLGGSSSPNPTVVAAANGQPAFAWDF